MSAPPGRPKARSPYSGRMAHSAGRALQVMLPRALRSVGESVTLPGLRSVFRGAGGPAGLRCASAIDSPSGQTATSSLDGETLPFKRQGYHAYWYGSGTAALAAALLVAIRRKPHELPEVVIPAYCCPDLVAAVRFAGASPVLADTLPGLPLIDPAALSVALRPATAAVVHLGFLGLPGNGGDLRAVIGNHGAALIEDAAHRHPGAEAPGSDADSIVFSFGRGKPLSVRCGGLLLQRTRGDDRDRAIPPDPEPAIDSIAARLGHLVRCCAYNVAIDPTAYWFLTRLLGIPTDVIRFRDLQRLTGFPASLAPLLARQAARMNLDGWREKRVRSDLERIGGPWVDVAGQVALHLPSGFPDHGMRLWRYPLLLESERERNHLFENLWRAGLGPSRLYLKPLGEMASLKDLVRGASTPMASDFARRLLALPLHSSMRTQDYDRMHAVLRAFAATRARPSIAQLAAG